MFCDNETVFSRGAAVKMCCYLNREIILSNTDHLTIIFGPRLKECLLRKTFQVTAELFSYYWTASLAEIPPAMAATSRLMSLKSPGQKCNLIGRLLLPIHKHTVQSVDPVEPCYCMTPCNFCVSLRTLSLYVFGQ